MNYVILKEDIHYVVGSYLFLISLIDEQKTLNC